MSDYQYKYNAKKTAYDTKYRAEHYEQVAIRLPKGYRDKLKALAESNGTSVNQYMVDLIDKELNISTDHNI